jgi:type I restriction enzyme R subunit
LIAEAKERRVAFADIQELADRISRPPHNWTPDIIWTAYEAVDVGKVRHSDRHTLTDLVSLLRYTVGLDNELVPYAAKVQERYAAWLAQQAQAGSNFSPLERWWLDRMVDVIASSAGITADDLDRAPFIDKGGVDGALRDLGDRAETYLEQLNAELTA